MYKYPFVIAEVGCNHMGNMETAHELIKMASVFCNVDSVKFQKRCNKELLPPEQYNAPHPNPYNSYGKTYGEHREFLEFTAEQHAQLKTWCEEFNLIYSTSVWDLTSAKEITGLNPKFVKIPSACNNHYPMMEWLCENYNGEIHISLGMTTKREEKELIEFFIKRRRNEDLVIYSCTSGYPVPDEDTCILEVKRLLEQYGSKVKNIGFSGHHMGIALDIAAYTLGAAVFERHFTLDRTWKGTDHAASLEPDGLRRIKRNLISAQKALAYKHDEILPIEKVQRDKLKYKGHGNTDNKVAKEKNPTTDNSDNMALKQYLQKLNKIFNSQPQMFGKTDKGRMYYQSFEPLNIKGQRPTELRFNTYNLESILSKEKRVLDIGCNCGFLSLYVSKFVKSVIGVEFNKTLIDMANLTKSYLNISNCDFYCKDFNQFKTDEKFDIIFSFAVHYWIKMPMKNYGATLAKLLNKGGVVLIESQNVTTVDADFEIKIKDFCDDLFELVREGSIYDDGAIPRKFKFLRLIK